MTDDDQNVSQEKSYEQVVEDAHMTLTSSKKTESSKQSSSVSSDFASKFLIMENVPPAVDEVASMMNVKSRQEESSTQAPFLFTVPEMAIPETATAHTTTAPPTILMVNPLPQLTTPSPAVITVPTTTSIFALLDFSSLFGFDQRVSTLEMELSQLKQADHSVQFLESIRSQLPTIVDDLLSIRIGYATRTALQSYTKELEKKAQEERKLYIDVVEKSVEDIIKDEVKSLLPQILPKEVSDFATPMIQSTITESLENVVLDEIFLLKPQSTYEAAASLTEFELKKIPLDKSEKTEEPVFETADTEMPKDQGDDMGNTKDQPNVEFRSSSSSRDTLSNNRSFRVSKRLEALRRKGNPHFYNKNRDVTYDNMTDQRHGFDNYYGVQGRLNMAIYALWGMSHWGSKFRQRFYGFARHMKSTHDVYSRKRIIIVTHVKVMNKYDYEYLEEIKERRDDNTLYKFKEGDLPNLNLCDIEDMLLLLVQKKSQTLKGMSSST
ncbi:hypothetical protein Tco_0777593 [Tanacetum coccineum]